MYFILATQARETLSEEVSRWTQGAFLTKLQQIQAWHEQSGGRGSGENAPLATESMAAGPFLSETAVDSIKGEELLGQGAFGYVIQAVCTTDGSRHAVKLGMHVSRMMILRLALCAGAFCTKLCAGCGSDWLRLAFRPPGVVFGKTPPKYAVEPRDCPCRPRAPQRVGVGVRVRVRVRVRVTVRVRVRSGVGLVWADVGG